MNKLCILLFTVTLGLVAWARQPCCGACADCPDRMGTLLDSDDGTPASFTARRSGADADARWKIGITSQGFYRVTYGELVAAGADASCLAGSDIRIFCRTQEVAILVSSEGAWATNDYALFYGVGLDGYYSATNAYWLGLAAGSRRMATRSVAPLTGAPAVTTYCSKITYNPDSLYRAFYRPLDDSWDHWFANIMIPTAASNFSVATDHFDGSSTGQLSLILDGLGSTTSVAPDHETEVRINGTVISGPSNILYDGEVAVFTNIAFSASLLNSSVSTVSLKQIQRSGVTSSNLAQSYLRSFDLYFPRQLFAAGGQFPFSGEASSNNYRIDGVAASNGVYLLDITDPFVPVQLTGYTNQVTTNGFALSFGDTTATGACYFLCATGQIRSVASLEYVHFRDLAATNHQADYIIVCPYAFRQNAYRLLKYRDTSGLASAVAPISDIYNEFGYGVTDAESLRRFLGYAFHHWSNPAPRYVVLLGDGTYDPKDNDGLVARDNFIPVKLGTTPFSWTAEDNWYVTVNGSDKLVDMAIGRVPVTNDAALGYVVDKIIAYEASPTNAAWRSKATLVADSTDTVDGTDFALASDTYVKGHLTTGGYTTTSANLGIAGAGVIRATISNNLTSGRAIVNYLGHGAFYLWSNSNIWDTNDIAHLANTNWPVVTVFTCNSGAFQNSTSQTVAEAFIGRQNAGAVACVAPTELSVEIFAEKIADGFYRALGEQKEKRLGDSLNLGLSNLYFNGNSSASELLGYEVFGDPALVVHPP